MTTQKLVTVLSVHKGTVLVELPDKSQDRFPLDDLAGVKEGDQVLVGIETVIKYAIAVNGEAVLSTLLERCFCGYNLKFTSTSDSGHIELEEDDDSQLRIFYKTENENAFLGTIKAEWDASHQFAVLWFSNEDAEPDVIFEYRTNEAIQEPVELFYEHTAFHIISNQDTVEAVLVREK